MACWQAGSLITRIPHARGARRGDNTRRTHLHIPQRHTRAAESHLQAAATGGDAMLRRGMNVQLFVLSASELPSSI